MRKINKEEKKQLYKYHLKQYGDKQIAKDLTNNYWYGVIDNYISDCPGYVGKMIFAVYGDSCFYELIVVRDGKLEHEDTELNRIKEED